MNGKTPDQESRNGSMRKIIGGKSKQAPEAHGEDPKMSKNGTASPNSNTPTNGASLSLSQNGEASKLTLFETDEKGSWSSTSNGTASVSSSPKKPDPEMDREGTLVIHFSTYGRSGQAHNTAKNIVKDLQVKGYNILDAIYNNEELEFDNKWSEPVVGGPEEPVF